MRLGTTRLRPHGAPGLPLVVLVAVWNWAPAALPQSLPERLPPVLDVAPLTGGGSPPQYWISPPAAAAPRVVGASAVDAATAHEAGLPPQLAAPFVPAAQPILEPEPELGFEFDVAESGKLPAGAKPGMLQSALLRSTWLAPAGGDDAFGMTDVTAQATLAAPPLPASFILFTPHFTAHFVQGPTMLDVPPRLYDASFEARWVKPCGQRWTFDLAVAPSVFSDLETSDSSAFRLTGRGVAVWQCRPTVQLVGGAMYLGRSDVTVLPVAGLIWTPHDDWRYEILFPRPKISRRLFRTDADVSWWVTAIGEFGGNTWAVQRLDGTDDKFTYSDLRLIGGVERQVAGRLTTRFEAGYVFDRQAEYAGGGKLKPADTVLLRAEIAY